MTRRVAPKPDTAPAPESSGWRGSLPDDVLQAAARRLVLFCGVAAGSWTVAVAIENLPTQLRTPTPFPWPGNLIAGVVVGLLLAAQVLIRARARRNCALSIDIGLGLLIVNAIGIALVNTWLPLPDPLDTRFISWITVVILAHAMIAPSSPLKTFIAAVIAASMDPLALVLAHVRGVPVPTVTEAVVLCAPNFICAFIAIVPAAVIHRLGRQISKAREMGSYELVELLGKGGMGEVWRAEHRLIARPAAIKLVRPESLTDGEPSTELILRRFEREVQATAVLSSPHTINVYDFGVTNDGCLYYVMELLLGRDLESLVKEFGPMPADRAVFLLRQICHSLAEAHVRGLVHRDIKPANIYNCRMGLEYDFIKVLDFGLVSFAHPGGPSPLLTTGDRATTGTPAYMAPEVILGAAEIDNRADVYSLGCVAYWLLTGHLVFEAESAMKMLMHHVQTPATPPSQRSELPIPRELDDLVMACLEKDPDKRPQRADELWQLTMCCRACEKWDQDSARRWWEAHLPQLTQPLVLALPATPSPADVAAVVSRTRAELSL